MASLSTATPGPDFGQEELAPPASDHPPRPQKIAPNLSGAPYTLLITLRCRALDAASPNPALGDSLAVKACERIDYPFEAMPLRAAAAVWVPVRASLFDSWATTFIEKHCGSGSGSGDAASRCTVLHLGCGLDSRYWRVVRPELAARVRWIDVDLPEVVELRSKVVDPPAAAQNCDYSLWGTDVLSTERRRPVVVTTASSSCCSVHPASDRTWLDSIPADRPTLILAEGLLMYLPPDAVLPLLERLVRHFSTQTGGGGGQVGFDTVSKGVVSTQALTSPIRQYGIAFTWGIDRGEELAGLGAAGVGAGRSKTKDGGGLRLLYGKSIVQSKEMRRRCGRRGRLRNLFFSWVPILKKPSRNLLYEF